VELSIGLDLKRLLFNHNVYNDAAGAAVVNGGSAGGMAAFTRQCRRACGQCAERVGPALWKGARIVVAHHARHRV
jgi:hypothetical protein